MKVVCSLLVDVLVLIVVLVILMLLVPLFELVVLLALCGDHHFARHDGLDEHVVVPLAVLEGPLDLLAHLEESLVVTDEFRKTHSPSSLRDFSSSPALARM